MLLGFIHVYVLGNTRVYKKARTRVLEMYFVPEEAGLKLRDCNAQVCISNVDLFGETSDIQSRLNH